MDFWLSGHPESVHTCPSAREGMTPSNSSREPRPYVRIKAKRVLSRGSGRDLPSIDTIVFRVRPDRTAAWSWVSRTASRWARIVFPICTDNGAYSGELEILVTAFMRSRPAPSRACLPGMTAHPVYNLRWMTIAQGEVDAQ